MILTTHSKIVVQKEAFLYIGKIKSIFHIFHCKVNIDAAYKSDTKP